jgi:hypothetical protein
MVFETITGIKLLRACKCLQERQRLISWYFKLLCDPLLCDVEVEDQRTLQCCQMLEVDTYWWYRFGMVGIADDGLPLLSRVQY